jgi:2-polyprenyl-3-methyl-5-hydroxy-6-metoxy-1,4-benzoquinol methylase
VDLKEFGLLGTGGEEAHWYYASKARALIQALGDRQPQRILDVGAGSGFFSRMLLRDTAAHSAICVDPGYTEDWSESHFAKPIAFHRASPIGEADLVLLMDVLEHVDDDVALVRELATSAKPGTRFIVSVPAFSWLWSQHDEFLEHRRRYRLNGLLGVLKAAGLKPVDGFYMFASIFPAVVAHRLWKRRWAPGQTARSDLRQHHGWTNTILTRLCVAESAVARHNRAFGLTAFGVAEKF